MYIEGSKELTPLADKKITDLTALATADATDVIPLVDVSAGTTKKTTISGLAAGIAPSLPDGTVPARSLTNDCKFKAYVSANWTSANNAASKVSFNGVDYD